MTIPSEPPSEAREPARPPETRRFAATDPPDAGAADPDGEGAALGLVYPALAHLLGPERFRALCAAAVARAGAARSLAADDLPPGAGAGPATGARIHGLLLHREARADDRIPSRLAADIAALEWAIHLAARAPRRAGERPAAPADLPAGDAWRAATLQPVRAFDVITVAFRLEAWVRRVHEGRRVTRLPIREEQHVVVHAPPCAVPVWWFALPPGHGRLLTQLALGLPIGAALAGAAGHGWIADEAAGRELLDAWLREGLFARVLPG